MSEIRLYNTLSKQKEVFKPTRKGLFDFKNKTVTMYNCGPTVYQSPHIGNFRPYIFADTLKRTFEFNGYAVKQVINITDVGHLVGDGDEGEDRMQVSVKKQRRNSKEISEEYTQEFFAGLKELNIETATTQFPRATGYIQEQIALIKQLEQRGCTYETSDGVYFDTSKFQKYGKLGDIDLAGLEEGHRVATNTEKRNPTDFALWKFSDTNRDQEWPSPWGVGFPGWHIECSAMAMKLLGQTIDIHTGGIDHIPTHHNNEIAQSEAVTHKPFARFWLHGAHLLIDGQKISKSLGNTIYLKDLAAHGVTPLGLRYWYLTASYHTQMNFTWEAVKGAQTAYNKLLLRVSRLRITNKGNRKTDSVYVESFIDAINDDLNTAKALATAWEMLNDKELSDYQKNTEICRFDSVLGLDIQASAQSLTEAEKNTIENLPSEIKKLKEERERARTDKDWQKADQIRKILEERGYKVID